MLISEDPAEVASLAGLLLELITAKKSIIDGFYMSEKILCDETRFARLFERMCQSVRN